jgi:uncharacterized repeat protein (TIGR03803 family)
VLSESVSARWTAVLAILTTTLLATSTLATAQQEVVLHSFNVGSTDGFEPSGNVIFAGPTHLYGTTPDGGTGGRGTVFELAATRGVWSETTQHPFDFNGTDGSSPSGLFLHAGKLYGTTQGGGSGSGTFYELTFTAGVGWAQTFTYSFGAYPNDGQGPGSGLVFVGSNIYGTTGAGGSNLNCGTSGENVGCGTVFELTPATGGAWTESVVYNFGSGTDGRVPVGLVFHSGSLYGTAEDGGAFGEGMVFALNLRTLVETDLHDFPPNNGTGTDGAVPNFGVVVDPATGDLYGTTSQGGTHNSGIAFELTAKTWNETVLHDFETSADGAFPFGLILDKNGNLYGTTLEGGTNNAGTAFELAAGTWTETILYTFCSVSTASQNCTDASFPNSGLTFDTNYNVYGTTQEGGANGWGTVFGIILHSFALSATPATISIAQGTGASSTISVADIGGFSGNVTLTASGLPKGVTASFSSKITNSTSTLTLTAGATAKTGPATVKITGTSGNLVQTITIDLTVNP